jgi:hypothetical protein
MAFSSILPVSSVRSGVLGVDGVDGVVLIESRSVDIVDIVVIDVVMSGDTSSCEDIFIFVSLLFCGCSG